MPEQLAIIGLGLMGGSLAFALHGFGAVIVGYDINEQTTQKAYAIGAIDKPAESLRAAVSDANAVFFCSSPKSIIQNMKESFPYLKKGCIVSEICGVKKDIVPFVEMCLPEGVAYVGLHPMAGKEIGGLENADSSLYRGTGMIMVLPEHVSEKAVQWVESLCMYIGARCVVQNTPEEHDAIIGYTSDLMHIAATALCASYPSNMTMAHTAGAFRDCTRIASIDADLWTELLMDNADSVLPHLRRYIDALSGFEDALRNRDTAFIHQFLQMAASNKKEMLER